MPRLFYEKPVLKGLNTQPAPASFNDYLEKVSKLVPAEILAAYLTMIGLVATIGDVNTKNIFYWVVFAAGLILTPLYIRKSAEAGKPWINHAWLSAAAFIVWCYVTSGATLMGTIDKDLYHPAIASIILVLFSLISALIPLNK